MAFAINPPNSPLVDTRGIVTPEWYRFFAKLQKLLGGDLIERLVLAPYISWTLSETLTNERVLTAGAGINLLIADPTATVSLSPSGVAASTYGSVTAFPQITVDQYGRITTASQITLNSDNVSEGATNLFFTNARARGAVSGGTGIVYNALTGVIAVSAILGGLDGMGSSTGLVEQTGATSFTKRAIGVATAASVLTRGDGDSRYLMAGGNAYFNIRTVTATTAPAADDYTLLCDATSGAIVVNLPAASGLARRVLVVKKIDASANTVTIDGNGSETIDGATTQVINTQFVSLTIQCDGASWWLI